MANIFKRLFSGGSGVYHTTYIKKDGEFISLEDDTKAFCEKWIKPVHPDNWNWGKRDFDKEGNDPTIQEARVIRDLVIDDLNKKTDTEVDLSTIDNAESLKAFFDPKSPHEAYNMEEFAYALKVELEHGKVKDANVTNNHPFLTAMIVLAHMSESVTYYKRLKVMETEALIFEAKRKLAKEDDEETKKMLSKAEADLKTAKADLEKRLSIMNEIPVMDKLDED